MSRRKRLLGIYADVGRTYKAWAPQLLVLGVIVFVPLGLIDALLNEVETNSLNVTEGLKVAAFLAAVGAVTVSSLFGEVFFSGAIAASLTHPEDEEAPSFRRLASHISYGKLIAVDILYVLILAVGFVALVIPGILALVYLSLAGPGGRAREAQRHRRLQAQLPPRPRPLLDGRRRGDPDRDRRRRAQRIHRRRRPRDRSATA